MKNGRLKALAFLCALCAIFPFFSATSLSAASVGGDEAFTNSVNEAVDRIAREDGFSGTILVARGSRVLVRKAAGLADRERAIPNTPETKFPLESVTKQFTAAAILLLVQDRKLSLSDTVSKYYPSIPGGWRKITIENLLTHSSGIVDCRCTNSDFKSYKDYIRLSEKGPLAFAPGSGFLYSNAGYGLLTAVIENISGQSYMNFVSSRILAPLGMHDTGYGIIPGGPVKGYVRSVSSGQVNWRIGQPADIATQGGFGGLYSTLDDMLIWYRALTDHKILSEASTQEMLTDYGHNYGFGWRFASKFGRKLVWHTGSDPAAGYASIVDRFPDEDLMIVALTNNTGITTSTATLVIEGKKTTFPANAARKAVEQVENLYFTGKVSN